MATATKNKMVKETLDQVTFKTKKIPMVGMSDGQLFKSDKFGILDIDNGRLVGQGMSGYYNMVSNSELIEASLAELRRAGHNDATIQHFTTHDGGRYHGFISLPQLNENVAVGDPVSMGVRISNSYDMSCVASISSVVKRLICSNGMTSDKTISATRRKHVGQWQPLELADGISRAIAGNQALLDFGRAISEYEIKVSDGIGIIDELNDNLFSPTFSKNVRQRWIQADPVNEVHGAPRTLWRLYNDFTYFLTRQVATKNPIREADKNSKLQNHLSEWLDNN